MRLPLLLCCLAMPALAEEPPLDACISDALTADAPVADCVNAQMRPCLELEEQSESAILCFTQNQQAFGTRIADRIAKIVETAPAEISAIAKIEAKYDLQQNLLQCARLEELRLVREDPGPGVVGATARCQATAVGLAYAKLRLQSRVLDE